MTGSVAGELIRTGHLVRGLRLAPLVVSALTVAGVLALHRAGGPAGEITPLRVVGLILALGSGFALDDTAAQTLQSSPYPLVRRLWLRIGCAAVVVVPLWTIALWQLLPAATGSAHRVSLSVGLTVELLAALAVVWATAAWGRRRGLDEPGIATAPVLLGLLFLGAMHPRARLLVGPGPQWSAAHMRWATVLACAAALLAVAMRESRRWPSGAGSTTQARQANEATSAVIVRGVRQPSGTTVAFHMRAVSNRYRQASEMSMMPTNLSLSTTGMWWMCAKSISPAASLTGVSVCTVTGSGPMRSSIRTSLTSLPSATTPVISLSVMMAIGR